MTQRYIFSVMNKFNKDTFYCKKLTPIIQSKGDRCTTNRPCNYMTYLFSTRYKMTEEPTRPR